MKPLTLASIDSMDGHQFEELIESLLRKMGYQVEGHKPAADGGIDIIAHNTEPFVGGKYIIQCKRQGGTISESVVRDLYGVLTDQRANKGIIVTNADFSPAAVKFAAGKPLELVNGPTLLSLLAKHFETTAAPPPLPRLSLHHEALYRGLADELDAVLEAYRPIVAGSAFRQGKSLQTVKGFVSFVVQRSSQIENFGNSLGLHLKVSMEDFHTWERLPNFDAGRHVQRARAQLRENLRELLRSFQSAYFVDVPSSCEAAKGALVDAYKALFAALDAMRVMFREVTQQPCRHLLADGSVSLDFSPEHRARIVQCGQRLREELDKLTAPARPCFVATAVYGSADACQVAALRRYRDQRLARTALGRAFIGAYYLLGPSGAALVTALPGLRAPLRLALDALVLRLQARD